MQRLFLLSLLAILFPGCLTGCQLFEANTEPLERGVTMLTSEVVKPAVEKAAAELTARTAQLQGQGSLINPGYEVEFEGGMFNGVKGKFIIKVTGVSANIAGAAQSDAGQEATVEPPVNRGEDTPD